jgi:hypothetical protein
MESFPFCLHEHRAIAKNMRLHETHRRTAIKSMAGGPPQGELIRDHGMTRPVQACSQKALSAN